jgi:hypothetical protein
MLCVCPAWVCIVFGTNLTSRISPSGTVITPALSEIVASVPVVIAKVLLAEASGIVVVVPVKLVICNSKSSISKPLSTAGLLKLTPVSVKCMLFAATLLVYATPSTLRPPAVNELLAIMLVITGRFSSLVRKVQGVAGRGIVFPQASVIVLLVW